MALATREAAIAGQYYEPQKRGHLRNWGVFLYAFFFFQLFPCLGMNVRALLVDLQPFVVRKLVSYNTLLV